MQAIEKRGISYKDIRDQNYDAVRHKLDVFYPAERSTLHSVLIFIHGGTWINGSKDIYVPFGLNLAEKGIVAVNINYRLGDVVDISKMAVDCAEAVKWVYENIEEWGGDKDKITLSGHSAGGHLAALIALDSSYFDALGFHNPIQNVVLIDAFGLNIGSFIRSHGSYYLHQIEKIFTSDQKTWDKASPINHLMKEVVPFLILVGAQTYPFLKMDNELFLNKLKQNRVRSIFREIPGKSHVGMITQFEKKENPLYEDLVNWINGRAKVVN